MDKKGEKMAAIIIAIIGVAFFTTLLILNKINQPTYCFLIALATLLSIVIFGFHRLQELDLKNLRVTLREIKATQKEIFAKEEDLKKTALLMSQIMALSNSAQGRFGDKEGVKLRREWYENKLDKIIANFNFSDDEIQDIRKFAEKYKEIDRIFADRDGLRTTDPDYQEVKSKLEELSSEIREMLKKDVIERK